MIMFMVDQYNDLVINFAQVVCFMPQSLNTANKNPHKIIFAMIDDQEFEWTYPDAKVRDDMYQHLLNKILNLKLE